MDEQVEPAGDEALVPAVAPPPRRGVTPRKQIHKAKAASRRQFSAEEKIRIVMEGIRGDQSIADPNDGEGRLPERAGLHWRYLVLRDRPRRCQEARARRWNAETGSIRCSGRGVRACPRGGSRRKTWRSR